MAEYYIVSQRKMRRDPAIGCLVEFEDVLLNACQGKLITPVLSDQPSKTTIIKQFQPAIQVEIPRHQTSDEQVLILVGMDWNICSVLSSIPNWRSRFDIVCAYIFDSFSFLPTPPTSLLASIKSKFSRSLTTIQRLDHVFLPMTGGLDLYQKALRIPVTMIPYGCDVVKFGSNIVDRSIDLIGYGRQDVEHSRLFAEAYNNPKSSRMYYHTDHMSINAVHDFYTHRAFFWKILRQSQIALAYDPLVTNPERFPFSIVTQRWFECLTAGCMIVGRRPTCPEADQLLSWEDATIELPDNTADILPFVEDLLNDKQRLQAAHQRNAFNALAYHDWRYRVADMLNYLNLSQPESLQKELNDLHNLTASLLRSATTNLQQNLLDRSNVLVQQLPSS